MAERAAAVNARTAGARGLCAIGEQAIVADAYEAFGQHVQQETPEELGSMQRHDFAAIAVVV